MPVRMPISKSADTISGLPGAIKKICEQILVDRDVRVNCITIEFMHLTFEHVGVQLGQDAEEGDVSEGLLVWEQPIGDWHIQSSVRCCYDDKELLEGRWASAEGTVNRQYVSMQ